jgi:hypothetical protein
MEAIYSSETPVVSLRFHKCISYKVPDIETTFGIFPNTFYFSEASITGIAYRLLRVEGTFTQLHLLAM